MGIKVSIAFDVDGVETEEQAKDVMAWLLSDYHAGLSGRYVAKYAEPNRTTDSLRQLESRPSGQEKPNEKEE